MARDRDIAAFAERAPGYQDGWRGPLHHQIADRTAGLALDCVPAPQRILDVGCGTGYLVRRLAARVLAALELVGIDVARDDQGGPGRGRRQPAALRYGHGRAAAPGRGNLRLVVSTTSFDHWADQQAASPGFSPGCLADWRVDRKRCS